MQKDIIRELADRYGIQEIVGMDLAEAAERFANVYDEGRTLTPWEVLGVTAAATPAEIEAAYRNKMALAALWVNSSDPQRAASAEEQIRDYTAALMIIQAD